MESAFVRRSPDPRIQSAFAFIEANIHRKISLSEMAERSGLSAARFSHLFALATGMPPGRYIRHRRRTGAKSLNRPQPEAPGRGRRARNTSRDSA